MDHCKFIGIVKQFPQVWDRNCASFRDKDVKRAAWEQIGLIMTNTATTCKDTFKSLREKYIREREKQTTYPEKYLHWQHLDSLKFLDPHIVLRKQSINYEDDVQKAAEYKNTINNDNNLIISDNNLFQTINDQNHSEFDKTLILLVKKATPIWDRKSNSYPSKQLKFQLWKNIAQTMKKDVNICMLRWKGLREKYIRQKSKYHEGDGKWEFLDDMSFLDKVIQYRRKQNDCGIGSDYTLQPYPLSCEMVDDTDSSNDYTTKIKTETTYDYDLMDSSYDSGASSAPAISRKRSASDYSDSSMMGNNGNNKMKKIEENNEQKVKTPEQMFGDLVAAMLAKKTERDKNIAMIEIMKILTKE